jgi:hypothetical protein
VRTRIVDDAAGRRTLHERFVESQRFAQVDPWAERANGKDAEEFARPVDALHLGGGDTQFIQRQFGRWERSARRGGPRRSVGSGKPARERESG